MALGSHSAIFNGSNQYAYNNNAVFAPNAPFSVEMWVKLGAEIGSGAYELFHSENNTVKWTSYMYYEYNGGARRLNFKCSRWVLIGYSAFHTIALGTANWVHLAFTRSSTVGKIYVNGVNVGSDSAISANTNGTTTTDNEVMIAAGQAENTSTVRNYSNIKQDEVRIWNDVRTGSEIQDNMYDELGGGEAGLVAYWKLNNNLTATTGGFNLTGVNSPTFSTDVPEESTPSMMIMF